MAYQRSRRPPDKAELVPLLGWTAVKKIRPGDALTGDYK